MKRKYLIYLLVIICMAGCAYAGESDYQDALIEVNK